MNGWKHHASKIISERKTMTFFFKPLHHPQQRTNFDNDSCHLIVRTLFFFFLNIKPNRIIFNDNAKWSITVFPSAFSYSARLVSGQPWTMSVAVSVSKRSSPLAVKCDLRPNNVHRQLWVPNIENMWNMDTPEIDEWHRRGYSPAKRMQGAPWEHCHQHIGALLKLAAAR